MCLLLCAAAVLLAPSGARATWSVNITDVTTKEVAVGIATCVNGIDLLELAPVLVVGKGTAASQAFVDAEGTRRATIFAGLSAGTPPADILTALEAFPGHETRQYGIADSNGDAVTFSGSGNFPFADGVVGSLGSLVYSIQGNIITGLPVISAAEQAILTTSGDIPAKLMAAMEAARAMGGDGRCSCPAGPEATSCGSPPPAFTNSAVNGGMVVSRIGDTDDASCDAGGCLDGDYFMRLNVSGDSFPNTDPVIQLQALFDAFRTSLEGRPDANRSRASFGPGSMQITLLDWRGLPVTAAIGSLSVQHAADSDALATIGSVVDTGGGSFSVPLSSTGTAGVDRFVVTMDDGIRAVTLTPNPSVDWRPIDIKPTSDENPVNPASNGSIPVVILGSSGFDVADVDVTTLAFGPGEAAPAHNQGGHLADTDGDATTDLVSHYATPETEIAFGDTEACVAGMLLDGTLFQGCDEIRTVPACGMGASLVLVLPLLIWLHGRLRPRARHARGHRDRAHTQRQVL